MFTKKFFKLFPPPKFLNIPYAGLDISDDAVRIIEYKEGMHGYTVHRYGKKLLDPGIVESGYIKKVDELTNIIATLAKELNVSIVKASLPEERMYLFKTEVPTRNEGQIRQNIESKLEENVPLTPADSVFFFDLLPESISKGKNTVSVSVAPLELVNYYRKVIESAGLSIISFEIQPKAIARATFNDDSSMETQMIVYFTNTRTGIYIVCGGVVCFTSTVAISAGFEPSVLKNELNRIYTYWGQYGEGILINKIVLTGKDAIKVSQYSDISPDPKIIIEVAEVWQNAFSHNKYIPPISREESLEYVVVAGLALPSY